MRVVIIGQNTYTDLQNEIFFFFFFFECSLSLGTQFLVSEFM